MQISNKINLLLNTSIRLILILGIVFLVGAFIFHQNSLNKSQTITPIQEKETVRSRHQIQGLRYDAYSNGKNILSIAADEFIIRNKKIGFFRFALMNEAEFRNANIHFYGLANSVKNKLSLSEVENKQKVKNPVDSNDSDDSQDLEEYSLNLKALFLKDSFPGLPLKQIASYRLTPVKIFLHDENKIISKISASCAEVRLDRKDIFFQGNVEVASGSKKLKADQLVLLPEKGILKTNSNYFFEGQSNRFPKSPLVTNILLSSIPMG
ncbi:LPS export ABC transporter periplasmic protein LptC [Thermodesulfobacteriota bacterium]